MNSFLRTKLNLLKVKAAALGYRLVHKEYNKKYEEGVESIVLVQNEQKKHNIGAIAVGKEDGSVVFTCFLIDIKRWKWAIDEGFSLDQMVDTDKLKNEIFIPSQISDLAKKLS